MRQSDEFWRLGLRLAAAGMAMLIWLPPPLSRACQLPMLFDAATHVRQGWCWEFWLNRYQTLITGVLALGAALLAWRGVRAQLADSEDSRLQSREVETRALRQGAAILMATVKGGYRALQALIDDEKIGIQSLRDFYESHTQQSTAIARFMERWQDAIITGALFEAMQDFSVAALQSSTANAQIAQDIAQPSRRFEGEQLTVHAPDIRRRQTEERQKAEALFDTAFGQFLTACLSELEAVAERRAELRRRTIRL